MTKTECLQKLSNIMRDVEIADVRKEELTKIIKSRIRFIDSHRSDEQLFKLIIRETEKDKKTLLDLSD